MVDKIGEVEVTHLDLFDDFDDYNSISSEEHMCNFKVLFVQVLEEISSLQITNEILYDAGYENMNDIMKNKFKINRKHNE